MIDKKLICRKKSNKKQSIIENIKHQSYYNTNDEQQNLLEYKQNENYKNTIKENSCVDFKKKRIEPKINKSKSLVSAQSTKYKHNQIQLQDNAQIEQHDIQSKKSKYQRIKTQQIYQPKWSTYKFLLHYPMRHIKLTVFTNTLIIATAVLQAYLPTLIGDLLDSTTQYQNQQKHKELSYRYLQILIVFTFIQFFRASSNQVWQELIYNDMREDVLKRFLSFDLNFFNSYRNGEIISRMTNNLASAKSAVSGNVILLIRNSVMAVVNVCCLFSMSWKLTLAILTTIPFFMLISICHSKFTKKYGKISKQYKANLLSLSEEIISGITTVKCFCTEGYEIKKFHKQLKKNERLSYKKGMNEGIFWSASSFFNQLGSLIVLWYGGLLILKQNELRAGELASFIIYAGQLSRCGSKISESFVKIVTTAGTFNGILKLLNYQNLVQEQNDAISRKISGSISFEKVFFQYPNSSVQVLQDINLSISCGEYVAFVGPSGSGKSTIIQLIERFYDPQKGNIFLDNLNLKQFKLKDLRNQIGLVSQETYLFDGTIESNIIYGTDNYSQDDFDWATKVSGVSNFANNKHQFPNGIKTFVGQHGFTLSGGQKQRIAIARALIKRPKILIFDEATSALDAESEYQVQSAIEELVKKQEKSITIIIIAHRLSTIVNCNRIFVLKRGAVVEIGTHQELLLRDGIYRQLVERQMVDNLKSDVDGETMAQ